MSKSFRKLVEEIKNKREIEKSLAPKAKGEIEFAAQQDFPPQIGGPRDKPHPAKGSDAKLNARSMKKTDDHRMNPRDTGLDKPSSRDSNFKPAGTKVSDQSGFKGSQTNTRANSNADAGDKAIVRKSPSAVQSVLDEGVLEQLQKIAYGGMPGNVTFKDGDHAMVTPKAAKSMMETYRKLNTTNASKFADSVNENAQGFLKMMKFAKV